MAFKKAISEIISEAAAFDDVKDRVDHLRKYDCAPLRTLLKFALDPKIKFLLPEGPTQYKPNKEYPDLHGMLYSRSRTLYLFVEGDSDAQRNLTQQKRERLWRELLECILPEDAEMLDRIKDKEIWKTINKAVVNRAFLPGTFI